MKAIKSLFYLLIIALMIWLGYKFFRPVPDKIIIKDDAIVEQIVDLGKLELVKYAVRDVIEQRELRTFLPDKKVLFVAVGEVVGCVDLRKVTKEDIQHHGSDSVTVYLPAPEICYAKVDHSRSKVYDISGAWWPGDTQGLVEGIYKIAEEKLYQHAKEMDIAGNTRKNAAVIFQPILKSITGKEVILKFRD